MLCGGAILPPPPPPRAGAGAGADLTTPRSGGGARPHPPPRGGRRGADRTSPWSRGGASLHPPLKVKEEVIHNRLSGTRGGKKGKKKRGVILHLISVVIQVQTPLVPSNPLKLPNLFLKMSDQKPFSMMTLTKNICAHFASRIIWLVVMIHKIHRFLFSFANIDFAENALRI